jgi:hypothetical protein
MDKIIATTIDNKVMVFNSEEEYREYVDKLMLRVLDNGFSTDGYKKEEWVGS